GEAVIAVEDELGITEQVDRTRRTCHADEAHRLSAGCVEMLVPGVQRDREQRAWPPFEARFRAIVVPHGGCAVALEDVDHLLVERVLRRSFLTRAELQQVAVVRGVRGIVVDEATQRVTPRPWLEPLRLQVPDVVSLNQRQTLGRYPLLVNGLTRAPARCDVEHGRRL